MLFSSLVFLFLFLPLVLAVHHLCFLPALRRAELQRRLANLVLLGFSLAFYAWGEWTLVLVMALSTAIDFGCGLWIHRAGPRTPAARLGLALSILSGLALLGYYKYFNFAVDNWNGLAAWLGLDALTWGEAWKVALPIGISFYKFQSMSYTIDVYRGRVPATTSPVDFACYVTMFPQLVAGPIVRYLDVARQLRERTLSLELFHSGVVRFVTGLAKKVLIANTVALATDRIFALEGAELTGGLAWLGILCYTLQIYYDFSAYSDMAIGLGRMLGFRFLENFLHPYSARSCQDFWHRWHVSLSTWFRDYLYIPLGGNRKGRVRTGLNLVAVFFLCGLWHGAQWTFVAWGLWHGLFLVVERLGLGRTLARLPALPGRLYTLGVVVVGWVFFRADTLEQAALYLEAMAGLGGATAPADLELGGAGLALALGCGALLSFPLAPTLARRTVAAVDRWRGARYAVGRLGTETVLLLSLVALFIASAAGLSSGTYNPFIYFRF